MAKNDYFVIVYKILRHLYDCLKSRNRINWNELTYFTTLSQNDSFKELGVEEYEIVETLDNTSCDECGEMDGQHFPLSEMEVGINAPPFHPYCRGTTCPYFEDLDGERVARDRDGNTYIVPSNINYKEWKEKYLKPETKKVPAAAKQQKAQKNETTPKYTRKQLDNMSVDKLRQTAEKRATEYYKFGKSNISFGDAKPEDVAKMLSQSGSKTNLKKDILSMQKTMSDNAVEKATLLAKDASIPASSKRIDVGKIDTSRLVVK